MPATLMPAAAALRMHLIEPTIEPPPGYMYRSGFVAALRDAREDSGREPNTGAIIDEPRTGHWLGAVGYLILLDQIGKCFAPAGITASHGSEQPSILRCLGKWAPHIRHDEACAIYALRNALAHDYSLFNKNANNPEFQHLFTLDRSTGSVVRLPRRPWPGDYAHPPEDCRTAVSLRELGSSVEAIVAAVRGSLPDGLDVLLAGGTDELLRRYGLLMPGPSMTRLIGTSTATSQVLGPSTPPTRRGDPEAP
jgi:hypothetical protein